MKVRRALPLALALTACLKDIAVDPAGYPCTDDAACGSEGQCLWAACVQRLASPFELRVSAGADTDRVDSQGHTWLSDRYAHGGRIDAVNVAVANTDDDFLYQKYRWGLTDYAVPVPCAAQYALRLHFAEIAGAYAARGARRFGVTAQGQTLVEDLDVVDSVGFATALQKRFTVAADGLTLTIGFVPIKDDPMVSAFELIQASACAR